MIRRDSSVRASLHIVRLATAQHASEMRLELRRWASVDMPPRVVEDLELAVHEAVANAVEHAYSRPHIALGTVELPGIRLEAGTEITVADRGHWDDTPSGPFRGRGIALMRQLVDEVTIDRRTDGTTVRLTHPIGVPGRGPR